MNNEEILAKMKEDIELRGLSKCTMREYIQHAAMFMRYHDKPADQLGETEIREFLLYLKNIRHLTNGGVNVYNSALRFLYGVTLNRMLNLGQIPRLKQNRSLPQLLTPQEIQLMLDNTPNLMYKALFMTIYGSGLRVSEAINLKVTDIDSGKMRILIRHGKGDRNRYATLSLRCLEALREYWKACKPKDYLFLTRLKKPPSAKAVNDALHASIQRAGIDKRITVHTLRHCFATHLLEQEVNLFHIKKLLGHTTIRSTVWYLHFSDTAAFAVKSPLDNLGGQDQ